jgi:hypothetical protein
VCAGTPIHQGKQSGNDERVANAREEDASSVSIKPVRHEQRVTSLEMSGQTPPRYS